jgi:type VI secretion system protein ImpM
MTPDPRAAPGWFGKIASLGDFAARRLAPEWVQSCDQWLSSALAASQAQLGHRWLEIYLNAPVWRFAWGPGVVDARWWFGVLMPSCDNVGRYFPLVVAQARERPPTDRIALDHLELWWAHLARAAMRTLHEQTSVDDFETTLTQAPPWPSAGALAVGPAVAAPDRARHDTAHGATLAQVLHGIAVHAMLERLRGATLWWPIGEAGEDFAVTVAQGLPDAGQFVDLLSGAW